jgi:hypothetical protein
MAQPSVKAQPTPMVQPSVKVQPSPMVKPNTQTRKATPKPATIASAKSLKAGVPVAKLNGL